MTKTRDKVYDAADNVKPYVQRALNDEKLREEVIRAFTLARGVYGDLVGSRGAVSAATRVATDEDMQAKLREAIEELRGAAGRLQGKRQSHSGRNAAVLLVGIAIGILFNPVTGPETRRWLKDMVGAGDDEFGDATDYSSNGGHTPTPAAVDES